MFKYTIVNYIKNFKYAFVVMGIVYLGLLIALAVYSAGENAAAVLTQVITNLTIQQILDITFFEEVLSDIGFTIAAVAVVLFFMKAADFLARIMIRGDINTHEKRTGIIAIVIRYIISLCTLTLFAFLTYLWVFSAIFIVVLYFAVKAVENIIEVRFIYYPQNKLRDMLRFKIIAKLTFANILAVILNLIFIIILSQIVGILIAAIIGLPLIIYGLLIVEFTAIAYFKGMKTNKKNIKGEVYDGKERDGNRGKKS